MIAGVAGVAASAASSLSGAELDPAETFGKAAPGVVIGGPVPGGPSWGSIGGGAARVAGSGNLIEAGMSAAFFSSEIGAITARIGQLEGEIGGLGLANVKLDSAKFEASFQAASQEYAQASHQADDAQQSFFNAMRMAGRTYDQQDLSRSQADAAQAPTARTATNATSMEALFSLVAALQSRGSARTIFGVMLGSATHLRDAGEIQRLALVSDRAGLIPTAGGIPVLARPDIDHDDPSQGFKSFPDTRREANALRVTVNTILQAISVYDAEHTTQSALETKWMAVVSDATSKVVH
jgi:hypothetical protein